MKAETLTKALLREVPILHLATSNKTGRPSNCALEFIERKGILYWRSGKGSGHSKNLQSRKDCFVCISRTFADGSGEGIQSLGKAKLLSEVKEIFAIRKLLDQKINKARSEKVLSEEDNREYWAFTPTKMFYMNENEFGYDRITLTQSK